MYKFYAIARDKKGLKDVNVSKMTGISTGTISDWKSGHIKQLKAEKLQKIADVLGVSVDYLMTGKDTEKTSTSGTPYYFDDATAQTAQELMTNPGLRVLFDAAKDCTPDDLKMATALLERLKGTDA